MFLQLTIYLYINKVYPETTIILDIFYIIKSNNILYSTKAVYAGEEKKSNIKYVKIEKGKRVEVREYTIKLKNGQDKIIKVLIPLN